MLLQIKTNKKTTNSPPASQSGVRHFESLLLLSYISGRDTPRESPFPLKPPTPTLIPPRLQWHPPGRKGGSNPLKPTPPPPTVYLSKSFFSLSIYSTQNPILSLPPPLLLHCISSFLPPACGHRLCTAKASLVSSPSSCACTAAAALFVPFPKCEPTRSEH